MPSLSSFVVEAAYQHYVALIGFIMPFPIPLCLWVCLTIEKCRLVSEASPR